MIHRSSVGALERLIAFLIEKYDGAFPLWLSPVQTKVLPVGEKFLPYARSIHTELINSGIRSDLDETNETLGKKVHSAKVEKVPYWIVVGEKEEKENMLTLEGRDGKKQVLILADAIAFLKKQIAEKINSGSRIFVRVARREVKRRKLCFPRSVSARCQCCLWRLLDKRLRAASSPIRVSKVLSASCASTTDTCLRVRRAVPIVVSQSSSGFISPNPL